MMRFLLTVVALLAALPAQAALNIFACEPEWAALAQAIGGEAVTLKTATTARQDPHHIQARPSLIAAMRQADLVVCSGAQLESGWLPVLLQRAANPRVQPGRPGYLEMAGQVALLEASGETDRAHGDVHPGGNPHFHLDPRNITRAAQALTERLMQLDAAHGADYQRRGQAFMARWRTAMAVWEAQAVALRDVPVVVQHNSWVYMVRWLGLRQVAILESKPGVPPSGAHLAQVLAGLEQAPARMILRAAYQDDRPARWLAARSDLPVVVLPYTVGGSPAAGDLFGLFDETLRLLRAVAP